MAKPKKLKRKKRIPAGPPVRDRDFAKVGELKDLDLRDTPTANAVVCMACGCAFMLHMGVGVLRAAPCLRCGKKGELSHKGSHGTHSDV